jgi:hypothetical protein
MAITSTVGQKTVGTSAVQLTSDTTAATTAIQRGIKFSVPTTGKCYVGPAALTTSTGFYINGVAEIHPADFAFVGDVWLISDTAAQQICYDIVGQTVTIA